MKKIHADELCSFFPYSAIRGMQHAVNTEDVQLIEDVRGEEWEVSYKEGFSIVLVNRITGQDYSVDPDLPFNI